LVVLFFELARDLFDVHEDLENDDMENYLEDKLKSSFFHQSMIDKDKDEDVSWFRDDVSGTTIDPKLKEIKTVEKKSRSLALKTKAADVESSDESSDECSDTENLNLWTRRFQKFIKMKGKMKNQQSKRYNKKSDNGSTKFTCFGCGK